MSSGQYLCQSSGRISGHVTSPPVIFSMALQCSAGIAFPPLAIFDTKDAGTSMALATLIARPRSAPTHDLKFMRNYLSEGYDLSITEGKYLLLADGYVIPNMQTVFETRRQGQRPMGAHWLPLTRRNSLNLPRQVFLRLVKNIYPRVIDNTYLRDK